MKKKKLKLKQSAKLTIAGSIFVIAMIMLFIKCVIEILGHHYIALYFGIGCAVFFATYFVIVVISDTLSEQKRLTSHNTPVSQVNSKLKNLRLNNNTKS